MTIHMAAHGRLTSDTKNIPTSTGTVMAGASLAVELSTGRDREPETEFVGVIAFGKVAELLLRQKKGELISVSGRVQLNCYESKGEQRRQLQIVCDSVVSARSVRPGGGKKRAKPDALKPTNGTPFNDRLMF